MTPKVDILASKLPSAKGSASASATRKSAGSRSARARSGMVAKLSEVLFIEGLRLSMNGQRDGCTGWRAGVGDCIVGPAPNALHAAPARTRG